MKHTVEVKKIPAKVVFTDEIAGSYGDKYKKTLTMVVEINYHLNTHDLYYLVCDNGSNFQYKDLPEAIKYYNSLD